MPKSSSTHPSGSLGPEVLTNFDQLLAGASTDSFFNDPLFGPNSYFLSDLEVLPQPFGDSPIGGESTSESSPEPSVGTTLTENSPLASQNPALSLLPDRSSQMPFPQKPTVSRANTFPNPQYESLFPNNLESGFVEDLTFPNGPTGPSTSTKSTPDNNASTTGTTTKRAHKAKADLLSACWTSPLCPNHDQDGPPPNPSNCGGGCAPFLFADDSALPTTSSINKLLNDAQESVLEDGVVEIKSHPKKRSESDTSTDEPVGRRLTNDRTTESEPKLKSESEDSPQAPTSDEKAKTRRRLPHNQVERKYRESLNTQLESLRRVVPALQQNQRVCDSADIEDLPTPSKPSKAVILASATAYIKSMEKDRKTLQEENNLLKSRIKALQALVKCEDCSLMQYVMDLKINQSK